MKTTIEIDDDLFRRAKARAASEGLSLKELFTEALRRRLEPGPGAATGPAWQRLAGGLADLRRESRRIERIIAEEFERIDPEDRL